jgi:hypothetical protein
MADGTESEILEQIRSLMSKLQPSTLDEPRTRPEGRGSQLDLCLWPETTVRGCLDAYLHVVCGKLARATLGDYQDRADWICRVLGESTPLDRVSYQDIEALVKRHGPSGTGLKLVTLRKRIRMFRAALSLQLDRGNIERLWKMPRQLTDDGQRGQDFYTVAEYAKFRQEVPEGRYRRFFDLGFWTGHHAYDVKRFTRAMLDPDYAWRDEQGEQIRAGAYLRQNHKNRRAVEIWFPAEPEFRGIVSEWILSNPQWGERSVVVGRIAGVSKVAHQAAERAGLHYVTPNRGLRRSFATMLASRGYDHEYIRQAMAHEGRIWTERESAQASPKVHTARPTTDTAHYCRPSSEFLINGIRRSG